MESYKRRDEICRLRCGTTRSFRNCLFFDLCLVAMLAIGTKESDIILHHHTNVHWNIEKHGWNI